LILGGWIEGMCLLEDSAQEGLAAIGPGVQVVLDDATVEWLVEVD
jgi:hypothetical protein